MEFAGQAALLAVTQQLPWFWPLWGAVLGSIAGSFLNCARYRLPRGESLRNPPSRCPSCQTRLTVPDLVPVFSYLALRGRCRHCKAPIPAGSLWVEVAMAVVGMALAWGLQSLLV